MAECKCLSPIIDDDCRLVILGTIPGSESLNKSQYYANQDNIFWDIIYRIFHEPLKADEKLTLSYDEKISILIENNIGLWDVLKSCEREGNRDSEILNEEVNDFASFFNKHRNIKLIVFNGTKAYNYFKKNYSASLSNYSYEILYSTSPSSPINSFHILYQWSKIKPLVTL